MTLILGICGTLERPARKVNEAGRGHAFFGVVDGFSPKGVEDEGEIKWRKDFLRKIGYKL